MRLFLSRLRCPFRAQPLVQWVWPLLVLLLLRPFQLSKIRRKLPRLPRGVLARRSGRGSPLPPPRQPRCRGLTRTPSLLITLRPSQALFVHWQSSPSISSLRRSHFPRWSRELRAPLQFAAARAFGPRPSTFWLLCQESRLSRSKKPKHTLLRVFQLTSRPLPCSPASPIQVQSIRRCPSVLSRWTSSWPSTLSVSSRLLRRFPIRF